MSAPGVVRRRASLRFTCVTNRVGLVGVGRGYGLSYRGRLELVSWLVVFLLRSLFAAVRGGLLPHHQQNCQQEREVWGGG